MNDTIIISKRLRKKKGHVISSKSAEIIPLTASSPEKKLESELHEMQAINIKSEKLIHQLREQLDESDLTNSRIFSIIAHDLRSPFQVILGSLELIKMKINGDDSSDFINYISMASESAARALKLLDDLLHWTISQKSDKKISPVRLNLYDLVENAVAFQIYSANQKGVQVKHTISYDMNVTGDSQMVKTILRNLMDNAIKFTNQGGEISVSAFENEGFVEISVSDTGVGMSAEQQKELFKIDALKTTKGTKNEYGYGFGLILCKELIEMHGGRLRVESKRDKGSKFTFTLPHYI